MEKNKTQGGKRGVFGGGGGSPPPPPPPELYLVLKLRYIIIRAKKFCWLSTPPLFNLLPTLMHNYHIQYMDVLCICCYLGK